METLEMVQITIEISENLLASLRKDADAFAADMRLAAAVKWYEMGMISQSCAAETAGVSRAEFLNSLGRWSVSPFQYTAEEIRAEALRE